jgi:hypothetical protein
MPRRVEITADPSLAQAKKTSAVFKALLRNPHGQHTASVREDHYKGHRIVIRTSYDIEIDGKKFHGNLDVSNSGTVQYHGIPNVSSNSAVELIRLVIDTFPDDFTGKPAKDHSHDTHHGAAHKSIARRKRHARSPKHSH